MQLLWLVLLVPVIALFVWIWRARKSGIYGEAARNQYFRKLAADLGFSVVTDDYFLQLEGLVDNSRTIIYPHHFEGPGLVTLIYLETKLPAQERNWIEPNVSLGRSLVGWKQKTPVDFEISGNHLNVPEILAMLNKLKHNYAYAGVTLPHRFSYSPLLQTSLDTWRHYVIFLALDAGRRPSHSQIQRALNDASALAILVTGRM